MNLHWLKERKRVLVSLGIGIMAGGLMMSMIPAQAVPTSVQVPDGSFSLACTVTGSQVACTGTLPTEAPTTPPPTTTPPTTVPPTTMPPATTPPPTTTPPRANNCLPSPSLCGFPDGTNSGVPAGTPLTVVNGNVSLNTAGQTYANREVHGCLEVHAANVTIINTKILANGCFYGVRNFSTGLVIRSSEITCGDSGGTGITMANYSLFRVNIHGCENGLNISDVGNVVMQDSWVHDLFFGPGAHTDGAQFGQGASTITFNHNTIDTLKAGNSAIIMWDEGDPQNTNVSLTTNLFNGGGFTLYCPRQNSSGVRILNNRFGDGFTYDYANGCTPGHVASWAGNVRDLNGAALAAK